MFYSIVVFVFLAFGRPLMPDAPEPLYLYGKEPWPRVRREGHKRSNGIVI